MENVFLCKFVTDLSVPGVDKDRYIVEYRGEIYDNINKRYLGHIIDNEGYHRVAIHTFDGFKSKYIHRICKIEFHGYHEDPRKNQIDHIDCDKSHNYPSNLEWVTKEENALRAIKNNLYYQFNIKMSKDDAELVCILLKHGYSYKQISDFLFPKYNQNTIRMIGKIYRGERWKHISSKYMPFPEIEKSIFYNETLPNYIVEYICCLLDHGKEIVEIDYIIRHTFDMMDYDLKYQISDIKEGKKYKSISYKYNFMKGE